MEFSRRPDQKVTSSHQKRQAYCYIRQSTLKQVFENTESTKRQYALRERAISLGWSVAQIVTIDSDLGETAASVAAEFRNPCDTPAMKRLFRTRAPARWNTIDKDTVDEVIFKTVKPRNRLMLELMARGGMRVGEVLKLAQNNVSEGNRQGATIRRGEDHFFGLSTVNEPGIVTPARLVPN